MAVQKNRNSRSRRGKQRGHDSLPTPALSRDPATGEWHRRHHITESGFYRGKPVVGLKTYSDDE